MSARCFAVIPAAGVGARMDAGIPKQYLKLAGQLIIERTINCFLDHPGIAGIVVAIAAHDPHWPMVAPRLGGEVSVVPGGAERCHSVLAGLNHWSRHGSGADDWILVHDAARPCLESKDLDTLIAALLDHPVGGLLAVPVKDTLKRAGAVQQVIETVDRHGLWQALTPQMFRLGALREAIEAALVEGKMVTDEAQAMELAGACPLLIEGSSKNIKITRPEDLLLAELYLKGTSIY